MFNKKLTLLLASFSGIFMFKSLQDKNRFLSDHASMRYWQVAFWGFLCIVNFFTLTLWYSQPNVFYTIPVIIQSALGLIFSMLLQVIFVRLWHSNLFIKAMINTLLVAMVSLLWTVGRMYVFEISTQESHIWGDFGGWYFSSIFIFVSWTALFYGIQYYRLLQEKSKDMLSAEARARESQIKRMEAQAAARDAQLQMLRYQLNPHFLCNTLTAINSLIELEENEKAQVMTVNLSHFLRYSLENMPEGKITLREEMETLSMYLAIEKTRFEDRLQINQLLSDATLDALLPSLLLQPIIENSMKHAIAKSEHGGVINLTSDIEGDALVLCVEDSGNGVAIDDDKVVNIFDKGVGMENTTRRLKILYDDRYSVLVQKSQLGGLKTSIRIPLEIAKQNNNQNNNKEKRRA